MNDSIPNDPLVHECLSAFDDWWGDTSNSVHKMYVIPAALKRDVMKAVFAAGFVAGGRIALREAAKCVDAMRTK